VWGSLERVHPIISPARQRRKKRRFCAVGAGFYDCLEILGKPTCLTRIDRALAKAGGA
jgi:hypothetical protein